MLQSALGENAPKISEPCSAVLLVAVRRLRERYFRSDLYNH